MKRLGMMMVLLAWLCVAKATVANEIDYKLNIAKEVAEVNDILSSKESLTIPDTLEYYGYKFAIKRINGITSSKVKELRLPNTLRDTIRYGMLTNKYLEKVYCPPHITKMDSAFMDCTALQEVELPNMLESADYLFQGCKSLKTCSIPIGVRKMTYTFYNCTSLKTIILHDYIKTISAYTFGLCTSLEDLTLPGKLETIEGGFEKTAIKRLDIPNSVKKISANAFKNSNIENVNIPLNLEVENFENSNFLLSIENLKEVRIDENDNKFKLIEGSVYFQKEDVAELWFSQTEGVFKLPTYKKISVNALALKKYLSELIVPKECEEFYLVGGNFKREL